MWPSHECFHLKWPPGISPYVRYRDTPTGVTEDGVHIHTHFHSVWSDTPTLPLNLHIDNRLHMFSHMYPYSYMLSAHS